MRKVAFAIAAAALMLLAGALTAEAMTGSGVLGLRSTAENFSPIDTVACRVSGPVCGLGRTWICRPPLLALGRNWSRAGDFTGRSRPGRC